MKRIKGVLFDLDGVFYVGDSIIPGGNETLKWLQINKIDYKFVTNNTTLSRKNLVKKLQKLGLKIDKNQVLSANYMGVLQLKKMGLKRCRLVLRPEAIIDYPSSVTDSPEAIVVGDIGNSWSYDLMNDLMNQIIDGAKLIALHKGRYFQTESGLKLDSGAFVAALEHATGQNAHIIGKPSASFFEMASSVINANPDELIMLGDDLINDIEGAQQAGLHAVLVQTGKFRKDLVEKSSIIPNGIINSVADLPNYLISKK